MLSRRSCRTWGFCGSCTQLPPAPLCSCLTSRPSACASARLLPRWMTLPMQQQQLCRSISRGRQLCLLPTPLARSASPGSARCTPSWCTLWWAPLFFFFFLIIHCHMAWLVHDSHLAVSPQQMQLIQHKAYTTHTSCITMYIWQLPEADVSTAIMLAVHMQLCTLSQMHCVQLLLSITVLSVSLH